MNTAHRLGVVFSLAAALVSSLPLFSQTPQIYTVAGSGPGAGLQSFGKSVADSAGNVYVADTWANRVVKVTNPTGANPGFVTIAGTGVAGWSGDNGAAADAQLKSPCGVALDVPEANLYIADVCGDPTNGRVRKVDLSSGTITLVNSGFNPRSIAVDNLGNVLVAGNITGGNFIYKVTVSAVTPIYDATTASGNYRPYYLSVDRTDAGNNVFFAASRGYIVKVHFAGNVLDNVTKLAGIGSCPAAPCWDGSASAPNTQMLDNSAFLVARDGWLYFASGMDNRYGRLRQDGSGTLELIAGNGSSSTTGDGGLATNAGIGNGNFWGAAVHNGNVFISGPVQTAQVMRWFPVSGNIKSVVTPGNPNYQGDGGAATSATVSNNIQKVAFDAAGNMYIADQGNRVIRKVDRATGRISTAIVGTQLDLGLPVNTQVGNFNIANDPQGNIYIATNINGLFKLTNAGAFSRLVSASGFSPSTLNDLAVDANGNVYVIAGSTAVYRVTSTGTNEGAVYSNANATLLSVGVDSGNRVWVTQATGAMRDSYSLAQVSPLGASLPLANIGTQAVATYPVTGDPRGGVMYMDNFAAKSYVSGPPAIVAGQVGTRGYSGDNGPAIDSTLSSALGLAFDSYCHLYISDSENRRIRKVENLVDVTVSTNPSGADVTVDGAQGGGAYTWLAGTPHTLSIASPQYPSSGTKLVFKNWSLPGNQTNSSTSISVTPGCLVAPTYTANFDANYQLTISASPSEGGSVNLASGTYYGADSNVALQATPNAKYRFDHWTGAVADANAASTTVTMSGPQTVVANFVRLYPDLTISKTHTGNFTQGETARMYSIVVSNNGTLETDGTSVTVVTALPPGLTATAMSGTDWNCNLGTLTCTSSSVVGVGAAFPTITLTVRVSPSAPPSLTSTATVSGGGEINTANNSATDVTTIIAAAAITLTPNPGPTITYGTPLTVAASVTQATGFPIASGTFSYRIDGGATQQAVLTNGGAALSLGVLPVGAHTLTVDYGGNASYSSGQQTLAITVNPALLTITADDKSRSYGAADPAFTASYSGFVNNEDQSALGGTLVCATTAVISSNVLGSPYPITCSGRTATNYSIAYVPGKLTVTAVPLSVSVRNETRTYGAANPAFGGTITGVLAGDNITATYSTGATPASTVGPHAIMATLVDPNNRLGNYIVTNTPGTLTITPAALTVEVNSTSRTYGANNPVFSGTLTGALAGDGISATYATTAVSGSPIGNYPITATLVDLSNKLTNYTVTNTPGTLTVDKAVLSVMANNKQRTYGTANPALDGALNGVVAGDGITATYATVADVASPAGTYPITVTISDPNGKLPNYSVTNTPGTLTVNRAALSITINNKQRPYGTANPTFDATVTGMVAGDGIILTYRTLADSTSPVGTYPITVAINDPNNKGTNYTWTQTNGTLTVDKASLSVTANDKQRTYGTANPALDGGLTGVVAGDGITAAYTTLADSTSPVGTYPITATLADPNGKLANYTVSNTPGTLMVTSATLSVSANNKQRTYGSANPPLDGSLTGLMAGDDITATYATTATASSPVGNGYAITATLVDPNNRLSNYSVSNTPGVLTVTPAALTVAADNASRTYGTANPVFGGTATGVIAGDDITVTYSTSASAASPVGTYPITVTLNDPNNKLANYTVSSTDGTLTVNQSALSVRASDKQRIYGTANPTFDGTLTGVLAGDNITATFSSAADTTSPVSSYPILATLVDPNGRLANYVVSNVSGTLTVIPAELKVTATNVSRQYGANNPLLTGTITGLAAGDNITGAYATAATTTTDVGNYEITAALVDPANRRANYTVTVVNGTLSVTPVPLAVTTNSKTRVYKTQNPTLDGSIEGLLNADPITASFSTTATELSDAGAYTITAKLVDPANKLPNYVVTNPGATLTVTAAATTTALTTTTGTIHAGGSVTFTATISSPAGTPTGTVTFLNGSTTLGTAALASGVATFSTSALVNGNSVITARYEGATNFLASTSVPVNQAVIAPAVTVAPASGPLNLSVPVGNSVTTQLTIGAQGRVTAPITLSCSGLPAGAQCVFSPASIGPAQVPTTASVTITTTRLKVLGAVRPFGFHSSLTFAFLVPGVVLLPPMFGGRNRKKKLLLFVMLTLLSLSMVACGSGSQGPGITNAGQSTPPGTYAVTVTGTSAGATTGSVNIVLTVTP